MHGETIGTALAAEQAVRSDAHVRKRSPQGHHRVLLLPSHQTPHVYGIATTRHDATKCFSNTARQGHAARTKPLTEVIPELAPERPHQPMSSRLPAVASPHAPPRAGEPLPRTCRLTLPTPCRHPAPCGVPCELKLGPERHALLELGSLARLAVMAVPGSRGGFRQQAEELFAQVRCIVERQSVPLTPTALMVFLRDRADEPLCRRLVAAAFGDAAPVTTLVEQPPCCGAALGLELWAAGGPSVRIERPGPGVLAVEADGIRWIHCGDVRTDPPVPDAYGESLAAFDRMQRRLEAAGAGFERVVRTWIYVNRITAEEAGRERYKELNRARTDFYAGIRFAGHMPAGDPTASPFPASTGIGTGGERITMACLAMQSSRPDVFTVPLENPQQTPAFDYQPHYSPQSPKFSRAMAVVQGHFVTTLISGTASIVDSRTVHPGDAERQTRQTIENIESLVSAANFARHGLPGAGATLKDVAKLRVYVKRAQDYGICRSAVEQALPGVPAIYLQADVCRPDLLVEIEAVTFSPLRPAAPPAP